MLSRVGLGLAVALLAVPNRDCGEIGVPVTGVTEVPAPAPAAARSADLFTSSVRPVLASRCAPCHEPGGVMYERLPFDDAGAVAAHSGPIAKRLKGSDREALERWVASLPAAK